MFSHDDIFMPLALTVIIDNKVRDPEMLEFRKQATALCELFELDQMSEKDVTSWFNQREPKIRETLNDKGKNTAVLRALTRFTEDIHVENMYDAMVCISISDQEFVRDESDLIKSAATIWGFDRPPFKVID